MSTHVSNWSGANFGKAAQCDNSAEVYESSSFGDNISRVKVPACLVATKRAEDVLQVVLPWLLVRLGKKEFRNEKSMFR